MEKTIKKEVLEINITLKEALKDVFSNWIFIFFSFVNSFLPFYGTIISACVGPHSSINITTIGLVISFISIFNQFLFLLALCLVFTLNRGMLDKKSMDVDRYTVTMIMLIYSFVSMLLFIGSTLLYVEYSTLYINFNKSFDYSVQLVLLLAPTFVINGFTYLNIQYKLETNKKASIITYTIYFVLHLVFIPLFYIAIPWPTDFQMIGLGLGFLVSSIITLSIVVFYNLTKEDLRQELKPSFDKQTFKFFFNRTSNFVFNFLLATIMKGFLVMAIGISLELQEKSTLASLMLTKIIWYNSLFFCGFFGDGLFYAIEYSKMRSLILNNNNYRTSLRIWATFASMTWIVTFIIVVLFNALAYNGLSYLYSSNQTEPIEYGFPDAKDIQNYLWCPTDSVQQPLTGNNTKILALAYLTIYHTSMNTFKILSIKTTKVNQKFSLVGLIANFIMLSLVMAFISTFSVAFNDRTKYGGFLDTFNGLDTFSFALMCISLIMLLPTLLGFVLKGIKKAKMNKKDKLFDEYKIVEY